ncbi:retrotransposon protein, putative, ty1-copia subclass [Tanacetum coccineum]
MIQPEPEDLPKDNPKLEIAVLSVKRDPTIGIRAKGGFVEVEGFEPPQEEVIPIRRSERTHRAPNRLCLNVEVEEHILGDLNEPTSYKAAMLDLESNKWIDAMNAEIQSMMDNMYVDPGRSSSLVVRPFGASALRKKTDIDGIVTSIKLVSAYYDYEIWKMDVKIAFLNGYLDEDIYMVQPKGYVFVLNRGALDLKSSKQSTTAMSATESEYIATLEAAMEAV